LVHTCIGRDMVFGLGRLHNLPDFWWVITMNVEIRVREEWGTDLQDWAWSVYREAFKVTDRETPCRQSFSHDELLAALADPKIQKWVVEIGGSLAGLGLITNDLECVPWINALYFETRYPKLFSKHLIYYLLGIAADSCFSGDRPGKLLLDAMIGSLPEDATVAFDYSEKANPAIPIFARRALPREFQSEVLDRQTYVVCRWD